MSDVARCLCIPGTRTALNPKCPFHGDSPKDPKRPWVLSERDRQALRDLRIAATDSEAIEQVRKLDEGRFNPPRSS